MSFARSFYGVARAQALMATVSARNGFSRKAFLPNSIRLLQLQQARYLSDEARSAIDSAVQSCPVVLFMKGTPEFPQCGFSRASIQILGLEGVDPDKFAAFNVLEDDELRSGIKEYSDWPTIPQLYVNGEFVGGCDILISMHRSGELTELLDKANALVKDEVDNFTTK
ncbi:thioredoxin-like protein [Lipomyces oligophaga]|uniref:thioredoxin-like protein n=1 Tax=Lipomyces oligophaga TaxID=45792 RepID=UPI0034CDCC7E